MHYESTPHGIIGKCVHVHKVIFLPSETDSPSASIHSNGIVNLLPCSTRSSPLVTSPQNLSRTGSPETNTIRVHVQHACSYASTHKLPHCKAQSTCCQDTTVTIYLHWQKLYLFFRANDCYIKLRWPLLVVKRFLT